MEKRIAMEKPIVAIASIESGWVSVTRKYFCEQPEVTFASYYYRGSLLLDDLKNGSEIQLVVLNDQLQDMDLRTFMQHYAMLHLKTPPILLAVCSQRYLGYMGNLYALGLNDCLIEPVSLTALFDRVLLLWQERDGGYVRVFCEELYASWGVELNDNTRYLTNAVLIACDHVRKLALEKELLWKVAKLQGCANSTIDSALRRLIDKLEHTHTPAYLAFKQEAAFKKDKPTISALVYAIKEKLLFSKKIEQATEQTTTSVEEDVAMI